ncbi:MAG: RlmE family RNA methyltransferase [Treponema sp.]|jgi:23S rRNA (uridine2552-2'-O)-methyltransferase|nr:RlmE family RNA methyltransferase [Treponema sp.]
MANYKKQDHWQLKAKKEGYPARSVYKLKEMDEKFGLIKPRITILDLGAAPGSWSLYILRKIPGASLVSVDLSPLSREYDKCLFDGENFSFIRGDFTAPPVRDGIISRGPYNLIISDAAPATTGNRVVDTSRSLELAEAAALYAETALSSGGSLAIKVFQGGDTRELLKRLGGLFKTAKSYKPQACRSDSFETYYLGFEKR